MGAMMDAVEKAIFADITGWIGAQTLRVINVNAAIVAREGLRNNFRVEYPVRNGALWVSEDWVRDRYLPGKWRGLLCGTRDTHRRPGDGEDNKLDRCVIFDVEPVNRFYRFACLRRDLSMALIAFRWWEEERFGVRALACDSVGTDAIFESYALEMLGVA